MSECACTVSGRKGTEWREAAAVVNVCPGDVGTDMADRDRGMQLVSTRDAVKNMGELFNVHVRCETGMFLIHVCQIGW